MPHLTLPNETAPTWTPFTRCTNCGCEVLRGVDPVHGRVDLSPVAGEMHLCGENCACRYLKETTDVP